MDFLRLVLMPDDPSKKIADLGPDETMVLVIQGPKHTLIAISEALASKSLDDEISDLLSP